MVCIAYNIKVIIPSSSLVCTHTWTQALILLANTRTEKNLLRKVFEGQSAKVVFWTHNLVTLRTKGLAVWWLSEPFKVYQKLQLQENKKTLKQDANIHLLGQRHCSCQAVLLQLLVWLASKWKKKKVTSL